MNKTIQEGLKQFQDKLHPDVMTMEEAEKLHFYAGAEWVLQILFSMNNMTPDAAAGVMQGLQEENSHLLRHAARRTRLGEQRCNV